MLNNHDIINHITEMQAAMAADKHGGVRRFIIAEMVKAGIIDAPPETTLDPYRDCPTDWTALQVAFFDNGEPEPARKRYRKGTDGISRETVQRTKMRFGGNIRAWTRENINFNNQKLISWQSNFYCWTAEQAKSVCADLLDEGYIDRTTVDLMDQVIVASNDPNARFSVPLLRIAGKCTRWLKGHIVVTILDEAGLPDRLAMVFPDQQITSSAQMTDKLTTGEKMKGAILQARIARHERFEPWATEIQITD